MKNKLNSIFIDKTPKAVDEEIKITKTSFGRSGQETSVKIKSLMEEEEPKEERRGFWGSKPLIKEKKQEEPIEIEPEEEIEEQEPEEESLFASPAPSLSESEEEDLEIPTFLRKKMK